jgi:hypothetical protein
MVSKANTRFYLWHFSDYCLKGKEKRKRKQTERNRKEQGVEREYT